MINLEQMLRQRQDQLRGRPRNWSDDFDDWCVRLDWRLVMLYGFSALWIGFVVGVLLAMHGETK